MAQKPSLMLKLVLVLAIAILLSSISDRFLLFFGDLVVAVGDRAAVTATFIVIVILAAVLSFLVATRR